MSKHYLQVNIGRNVGDVPMSDLTWLDFQNAVLRGLVDLIWDTEPSRTAPPSFGEIMVHSGGGTWGESVVEESVHLSYCLETGQLPAPQFARAITDFNNYLRGVADEYQQEAIAVITGSKLLKPAKEVIVL